MPIDDLRVSRPGPAPVRAGADAGRGRASA
jgi:hypothetical protein